ncbi:MAG: PHD finger domain-containing protein [Aeromonas sp.]
MRKKTCAKCAQFSPELHCRGCKKWVHSSCTKLSSNAISFYTGGGKARWVCDECLHLLDKLLNNLTNTTEAGTDTLDLLVNHTGEIVSPNVDNPKSPITQTSLQKQGRGKKNDNYPSRRQGIVSSSKANPQVNTNSVTHALMLRCDSQSDNSEVNSSLSHTGQKNQTEHQKYASDSAQVSHKSTSTPNLFQKVDFIRKNLIVFNVPESQQTSLIQRESDDRTQLKNLYVSLNISPKIELDVCRLRKAAPDDRPRPLRVTLPTAADAEHLLLMTSLKSGKSDTCMRAQPDFPWTIREARRNDIRNKTIMHYDRTCSVILRGVPELTEGDGSQCQKHDIDQWTYIRHKLGLTAEDCSAWSLRRLNRPDHIKITEPRLIRLTLLTPEMSTKLLESWYQNKHEFSQDVRLHPDKPRRNSTHNRLAELSQPLVAESSDDEQTQTSQSANTEILQHNKERMNTTATTATSKNDLLPAPENPESA